MKLIIEKQDEGFILVVPQENETLLLERSQARALFRMLNEEEFTDVYVPNGHPYDIAVAFDQDRLYIKDYDLLKKDPMLKDLKKKIDKGLLKHVTNNIKKKLAPYGVRIAAISLSAIIVAGVGIKIVSGINSNNNDNLPSYEAIQEEDLASPTIEADATDFVSPEVLVENEKRNEIDYLFSYYGDIFEMSEDLVLKLYGENVDRLMTSNNVEQDVIDVVYTYFENNLYDEIPSTHNDHTEEEQLLAILKYAKIRGVTDRDVLLTMLAVHKLETGHGESDYCRDYNNLGGIFFTNPNTNDFGIKHYPNLEVAAIDFNNVFIRIMERCKTKEWYDSNQSLEWNMNPIYCTEKMHPDDPEWYEIVGQVKQNIVDKGLLEELETKLDTLSTNIKQK